MTKPIPDKIKRLRQRRRGAGWRVWWEPEAAVAALGFQPVDLDAARPTWSVREAARLNREVEAARLTGGRARPAPRGQTIDALIDAYRRGMHFGNLSAKSRQSYGANLQAIGRKWGSHAVADFSKPVMRSWYESLYRNTGKSQAAALIRMMSILFSHAELIGWRPENSNPCFRLGMAIPKGRGRSIGWPELDLLVATADRLGLAATGAAILLSTLQGQRATTVRLTRPDDFQLRNVIGADGTERRVWTWAFIRTKRQNMGIMELHPEAASRLVRLIMTAAPDQPALLLDDRTGRPFSEDLLSKRFAQVRDAAMRIDPILKGVQFRDLRRTFGVLSRAGGASKDDTGDVLGNSAATNPTLGETYMPPSFYTSSRAVLAIRRPEPGKKKA